MSAAEPPVTYYCVLKENSLWCIASALSGINIYGNYHYLYLKTNG